MSTESMGGRWTPGPWIVVEGFARTGLDIQSDNPRDREGFGDIVIAENIGGLRKGKNFADHSEEVANAALIAALLALVEQAESIDVIGEFSAPELSRNINQARAALARAGVGQP